MRVLILLIAVFGYIAMTAHPAVAQEMPEWAAPQETSQRSAPGSGDNGCPAYNPNCNVEVEFDEGECPDYNPNCELGDIDPVPLGEGLALLALLGTGYAVRRLRRDPGEA